MRRRPSEHCRSRSPAKIKIRALTPSEVARETARLGSAYPSAMDHPLVSRPRAASVQLVRGAAAALVAAAGALHLYLWFDFFHTVHVVGTLFLLNAAAAAVIAVALAVSAKPIVLLAGLAYSVGTLVAFAISVRWGLFGYHESLWGSWQKAAGGVEVAATVLLAVELIRSRARAGA